MASFTGRFDETFNLATDVATARNHFGDLAQIAANYGNLESHEVVDDRTLKLVLPTENHGITSFQGRYTCSWTFPADNIVEWKTKPGSGNLVSTGKAVFTPTATGCTMEWTSSIELEMNVNRFVGKALGPVVRAFVSRDMGAFVRRMIAAL
ncbi:MAG: hypothetical protein KC912_03915 [Proteobacteria bacterium]|nr:hypothetical protein [Pseudomonadota bacterium]